MSGKLLDLGIMIKVKVSLTITFYRDFESPSYCLLRCSRMKCVSFIRNYILGKKSVIFIKNDAGYFNKKATEKGSYNRPLLFTLTPSVVNE